MDVVVGNNGNVAHEVRRYVASGFIPDVKPGFTPDVAGKRQAATLRKTKPVASGFIPDVKPGFVPVASGLVPDDAKMGPIPASIGEK